MMNALSLAASLTEINSVRDALTEWEARERPLIVHTQRWSRVYGMVTSWPEVLRWTAFRLVELSPWLQMQLQMAARHEPYGWKAL